MSAMSINSLSNIQSDAIATLFDAKSAAQASKVSTNNDGFEAAFQSALDLVNNTNDLQSEAEQAEIDFALGKTDNTHDLNIALQKANVSLQYTVAIKNKVLDAYNEIMNISI